ncbi:unnamed protein product, partial [Symbiodinium sp. CCMP2456]
CDKDQHHGAAQFRWSAGSPAGAPAAPTTKQSSQPVPSYRGGPDSAGPRLHRAILWRY